MSKIPPKKRKTPARSLHNICQKLRVPFHKSRAQMVRQASRTPTPNSGRDAR